MMDSDTTAQPSTGLSVQLAVADRGVAVKFSVDAGRTVALLGPNGAGKTTTLQALAGWLVPDAGRASLGSTVFFDLAEGAGTQQVWLPAKRRRIGYLAQKSRLFPHLTVSQNIAYGMPRAGIVTRKAQRAAAEQWLQRIGLTGFGQRKPHQLSGGQAQLVALARILASGPELVLLDEPLAALDASAAPAMRDILATELRGITTVLVSHHHDDVTALAHDVVHLSTAHS